MTSNATGITESRTGIHKTNFSVKLVERLIGEDIADEPQDIIKAARSLAHAEIHRICLKQSFAIGFHDTDA